MFIIVIKIFIGFHVSLRIEEYLKIFLKWLKTKNLKSGKNFSTRSDYKTDL